MKADLRLVIAEVAMGAGESVHALREAGIGVELLGYTIEVVVDPADPTPAATVRLCLGGARHPDDDHPPPRPAREANDRR